MCEICVSRWKTLMIQRFVLFANHSLGLVWIARARNGVWALFLQESQSWDPLDIVRLDMRCDVWVFSKPSQEKPDGITGMEP